MSMALNPDRATLNFLNAFPEEIRLRGEKLQNCLLYTSDAADE